MNLYNNSHKLQLNLGLNCAHIHGVGSAGHAKAAEWLLDRGAVVTARDGHGTQPLHWAARGGHPET